MAGPNDPTLLGKVAAKGQLSDARLNALVTDQGQPITVYTPVPTVVTQGTAGTYNWTCPAGVTSAQIEVWGGGGGGGGGDSGHGGGGGGGGAYAQEPSYPVTPGVTYTYVVGDGGDGAINNQGQGDDGGATYFDINGVTGGLGVYTPGGSSSSGLNGGAGGPRNTAQTFSHSGGNGGGDGTQSTGGCGGAGSGGFSNAGGAGAKSTTSTGAAGGAAGPGGGASGGTGGNAGLTGGDGNSPGAGGGGVGAATAAGQVVLSYSPVLSATYYGSDAIGGNANNPYSAAGTTMYQGGLFTGDGQYLGTMKSVMILPSSVASDLSAVTVDTVRLALTNLTSQNSTGLIVVLNYSAATALPASFDGVTGVTAGQVWAAPMGVSHTQNVSDALAGPLKTGAAKALILGPPPAFDDGYYGTFAGAGQAGTPVLTVIGHTGAAQVHSGDGGDGQVVITYTLPGVPVGGIMPVASTDDNGHDFAAGYTGQVSAFQPNSSPANVETWHTIGGANGWTSGIKYQLRSDNCVYVLGLATSPSSITSTVAIILPAAYRPQTTNDYPVSAHSGTIAGVFVRVDTSGNVNLINAVASTVYTVAVIVPLDY